MALLPSPWLQLSLIAVCLMSSSAPTGLPGSPPWPLLYSRRASAPCLQECGTVHFPIRFCLNLLAGLAERCGVCGCASSFLMGRGTCAEC